MLVCPLCGKQQKMMETLRLELEEAKEKIQRLEKEKNERTDLPKDH